MKKYIILSLAAFFLTTSCFANVYSNPSYKKRFEIADQVLIVSVLKITDLPVFDQPAHVSLILDAHQVEFEVQTAIKGKSEQTITLVFYSISSKNKMIINGPRYVEFQKRKPDTNYLLFLKDGKLLYPSDDQILSCVRLPSATYYDFE